MHTVKLLTVFVEHHQILAYFAIFIGLVFEGEFVLISTGVLAHLGALNFWFSLLFIMLGGFGKTFLFYYFGGLIRRKLPNAKILKFIEKRVKDAVPRFSQKPFWSIFISKFIIGTNWIVMAYAGFVKVDIKKYLKAEVASTIIWAPSLLCLGYFFSFTAFSISKEISKFSLIILILVVLFFLIDKFIAWLYELFEEFHVEI